ncbi:hypothetical protein [Asaia prunellae]|uniref:hypothetical protein n=1 Tax=Asaia prunellae TaxID=610245 RepID=UPI001FB12166|nr:hypothetical protein [Asaia prunellae]
MARVASVSALAGEPPKAAALTIIDEATLVLPLEGLIDIGAEIQRLEKEIDRLGKEIEKVERKLGNADFVARAKPEVVEENRERLNSFTHDRTRLAAALNRLSGS